MNKCEDYPCCGHGPAPYGDGGGCPDKQGRFNCVTCGKRLKRGYYSAICQACHKRNNRRDELGMTAQDRYDEEWR